MNLNELTIRLLILFLPGILCSLIVAKLTTHRDMRPLDHVIPSLLSGFLVFLTYSLFIRLWNPALRWWLYFPPYQLLPDPSGTPHSVPNRAIAVALLLSVPVAFAVAALRNHRVLTAVARNLKVTRKFDDRDVWSYVMNAAPDGTWLAIRDRNAGLYYVGRLSAHSDEESVREIVLDNTIVYDNETGEERYSPGRVYFSFPFEGLIIELYPPEGERA
jgi:hypothetical protein